MNGSPAIIAFALFALLFILGLLFSSRAGTRVRRAPTPPPVEESTVDGGGGGSWGDHDHAGSTGTTPQRQDSHKTKW